NVVGVEGLPYEFLLLATHVRRRKEQPGRSFISAICLWLRNWLHVHLSFVCRLAAWCHTDQAQVALLILFHGRRDPPGGFDISGRYPENTKNEDQATIVEVAAEQGTTEDQRGHR